MSPVAITFVADAGQDVLAAAWARERFTIELVHWDVTVKYGSQAESSRKPPDRVHSQLHLPDGRLVRVHRQSPQVYGQRGLIEVTCERSIRFRDHAQTTS